MVLYRKFASKNIVFTISVRTGFLPNGVYLIDVLGADLLETEKVDNRKKHLPEMVEKFYEAAVYIALNLSELDGFKEHNGFYFSVYESLALPGIRVATPAQILTETNEIEIGKKQLLPYSVEERIVILLHEFSHNFVNTDPDSEKEADYWAYQIFFTKNYPEYKETNRDDLSVFNLSTILAEIEYAVH
jgi:hypothetical protein